MMPWLCEVHFGQRILNGQFHLLAQRTSKSNQLASCLVAAFSIITARPSASTPVVVIALIPSLCLVLIRCVLDSSDTYFLLLSNAIKETYDRKVFQSTPQSLLVILNTPVTLNALHTREQQCQRVRPPTNTMKRT